MASSENLELGTAQYFGRLAATYGAGEYYRKRREAALAEIRRQLGEVDTILDLGCGNGTYLMEFQKSIGPRHLVGADLSFEMLREARARSEACPLVSCDATLLPFRSESFRTIFCSHVLQFVGDLPRCIEDIARCLLRGGTLVICGGEFGVRERLRMMIGDERWAQFVKELPRPRGAHIRRGLVEYERAAETAGLRVDRRGAAFVGTWADLAEFYRVRWLPLVEASSRTSLTTVLEDLVAVRGGEQIDLAESLLFCRKPAR